MKENSESMRIHTFLFINSQISCKIRELIVEINLMDVGKPSKQRQTSYSRRDFIHERNAINVRTVAKVLSEPAS